MSIEPGFLATMASDFNIRLLNHSPAPPASISPSAVAPARDHGEKLPIGHGWGRATRRGIFDCGRFADENDWPSHGQPGWLWCRAVAGGVSSVTSKADGEHGGAGCSSLPQHAGRRGHRDRRAGVHVRGRVGSVRSPARVPRHGRCKRDHLSLLLDAVSLRFYAWAPCGTPGGMRAGGWSNRVAAAIEATET